MHVTLPPLATPGKLVEFQLRAPLVDVPDGPLDALALAAGESRGILLERSSSGGLKRKAPTMGNGGMFIGGAADGSAITSPPSRKRAPRGLSSAEAAIFGAHDEALAAVPLLRGEPGSRASPGSLTPRISHPAVGIQVRRFDMDAASRRNTPDTSELSRLRTMPELLHTWLACRALCPRLPLPAFSLAELEQTLCLGPDIAATPAAAALAATAEDAAAPYATDLDAAAPTAATPDATAPNDSRPPAEGLLKRLHRALLTGVVAAAAQPETIDRETRAWLSEGENWEVALFAALQTGVWAKRHTAGTFPMWRPEGRRVGGKFGQWVTETGPALCGTFGCVLPNNHSGLHKLPESTADRPRTARARRAEVALPTEEERMVLRARAAAAGRAPPPSRAPSLLLRRRATVCSGGATLGRSTTGRARGGSGGAGLDGAGGSGAGGTRGRGAGAASVDGSVRRARSAGPAPRAALSMLGTAHGRRTQGGDQRTRGNAPRR